MGVYIKDMEMPVIEMEWTIRRGADGKWYAVDTNAETTDGEWHELVPVPPHGRLIDADALAVNDGWLAEAEEYRTHISFVYSNDIDNAPTVIPAEWVESGENGTDDE